MMDRPVNTNSVGRRTKKAFNRKVANRLADQRGRRSQGVFARNTTASQQTISKYERGRLPTSWLFLAKLREQEGVDLNELLSLNGLEESTDRR